MTHIHGVYLDDQSSDKVDHDVHDGAVHSVFHDNMAHHNGVCHDKEAHRNGNIHHAYHYDDQYPDEASNMDLVQRQNFHKNLA